MGVVEDQLQNWQDKIKYNIDHIKDAQTSIERHLKTAREFEEDIVKYQKEIDEYRCMIELVMSEINKRDETEEEQQEPNKLSDRWRNIILGK